MAYIFRLTLLAFVFLLVSCNQNQQAGDSQLALMKTTNPTPMKTEQEKSHAEVKNIKQDISNFEEIYDVAVVQGKKETLIAYKVKHLQRFRMKEIEKNINKMLEKKYSKEDFIVSSDYKIFLEAVRLNERINAGKVSDKDAENRLNQIVKMNSDMK